MGRRAQGTPAEKQPSPHDRRPPRAVHGPQEEFLFWIGITNFGGRVFSRLLDTCPSPKGDSKRPEEIPPKWSLSRVPPGFQKNPEPLVGKGHILGNRCAFVSIMLIPQES